MSVTADDVVKNPRVMPKAGRETKNVPSAITALYLGNTRIAKKAAAAIAVRVAVMSANFVSIGDLGRSIKPKPHSKSSKF